MERFDLGEGRVESGRILLQRSLAFIAVVHLFLG